MSWQIEYHRGGWRKLVALALLVWSVRMPLALAEPPAAPPSHSAPNAPADDALDNDSDQAPENGGVDDGADSDMEGDPSRNLFRRFWPRWPTVDEHARNHRTVREAFRDVVKPAVASTVQVLSNNRRVAYGTIIDAQGFVLTKASELKDKLECRLADGRRLAAELVTINDDLDVALLHVPASDLVPVVWRTGDLPAPGSWLVSVGVGELPAAVGVVSVAPRSIPMPRPVLGVMLESAEGGARVTDVMPDSPAKDAGLEANDIIIEVNGKAVTSQEDLVNQIRAMRPGDRVTLVFLRGESKKSVSAVLTEIGSLSQGRRVDFQNSLGGPLSNRRWGFPSVLQHDTALRPNDCGGPILDLDGHAVGINIARAGRVASYALPVTVLLPVLEDVRAGKFGPSGAQSEKEIALRIHELRIAVQELTERFTRLEEQVAAKRQDLKDHPENTSPEDSDEVSRLEAAAASAREQLDRVTTELKRYESAGAISSAVP